MSKKILILMLVLLLAACEGDPSVDPEAVCERACREAGLEYEGFGGWDDCLGRTSQDEVVNIWKGR